MYEPPKTPEFYQTVAGRKFFDKTMPDLVNELRKLNENLEQLIPKTKEQPKYLCPFDQTSMKLSERSGYIYVCSRGHELKYDKVP